MAFTPKFNIGELVDQFAKMPKPAAAAREKSAKPKVESSRYSVVSKFPGIRALHEYWLVKLATQLEPYQMKAALMNIMEQEYPYKKNDTGKKRNFEFIRTDADKNAIMDANGDPIQRAYSKKHYDSYVNQILGKGILYHHEELGLTPEEIEAAQAAYAAKTKKPEAAVEEAPAE